MSTTIVATIAAAQALVGANQPPANEILVLDNGFSQKARYLYDPASSAADGNAGQLVIVPSGSVGRFVRSDPFVDLVLPVTFATADAAVLSLIPAGVTLVPIYDLTFLECTAAWSGGVASTIGLSLSTPALARTKGNLAGAAAGNAGFTSVSFFQFTIGSQFLAGALQPVLSPGSQVMFDRIVSAFTAGTGRVHMGCMNYAATITPVAPP